MPRRQLLQGTEPAKRMPFYQPLMRVVFRNDYYPPPSGSPDFTVRPSAATADLLQQLGLVFRTGPAGFVILYDERSTASLLRNLQRLAIQMGSPPRCEAWTHLSFVVWLDQPSFVNFTDLPLDLDPRERNFYFTNQEAHRDRESGLTVLNQGRRVTANELLVTVPAQVKIPVGPEVLAVQVLDLSGAIVLCRPRCVPAALARRMPPNAISCADVQEHGSPPESEVCRDALFLDFDLLPQGRYTIEEIGTNGQVRARRPVLSTEASPIPFAYITLLLTRPKPGEPGIYPVQGLWRRKPTVTEIDYEIVFRRRSTVWRYYVVLPRSAEADGLRIHCQSGPRVPFLGPDRVVLNDGTPAFRFTAAKPLPLLARPDARFLLLSDAGVLLDPLPMAASRQVLPVEGGRPPRTAFSDIYVYV